jgi:DinB superfamily
MSKSDIKKQIEQYYASTLKTLDHFGQYDEAALNKKPTDGGWSALQNIEHLILAESLSLKYMQKKTASGDSDFDKAGLKTWYRSTVLSLFMRYGGKVAAPSAVGTASLSEQSTLAEMRTRWAENEVNWLQFVEQMPDSWASMAIYKHPRAGRLSWSGMLGFFQLHHQRHLIQMKKAILSLVFCCMALVGFAQDKPDSPCGAPPGISKWLEQYLAHEQEHSSDLDTVLYTRLQLHLLAKDDGIGRIKTSQLLDALCRLNKDFEASKIQFFYDKPWLLVNKSQWYDHNALATGIQMMLQSDVDSAINSYFVTDPAGNCGYNLPYAGVAISHGCAGAGDHTWAHEIGHNLRLPHPFIGWEGKTYNYNTPTPLKVVYDYTNFHDTLDVGPTNDTALVEFVDRAKNCGLAADRLCLTPPDYIAQRWVCGTNGMSTLKQKDPDGVDFFSDGSLFMSYADDACQNRFSTDEIAVMRANLRTEKKGYLKPDFVPQTITEAAAAVMPIGGQQVSSNAVTMHWKKVVGATHYLVQANVINQNFPIVQQEIIVSDTFGTFLNLTANKTWYYRIRPFNPGFWCTGFSPVASFFTLAPSSVQEADMSDWFVFPTVVQLGEVRLHLPDAQSFTGLLSVSDANGRVLAQKEVLNLGSNSALPIDFQEFSSGLYFIRLLDAEGQRVFKVVLP